MSGEGEGRAKVNANLRPDVVFVRADELCSFVNHFKGRIERPLWGGSFRNGPAGWGMSYKLNVLRKFTLRSVPYREPLVLTAAEKAFDELFITICQTNRRVFQAFSTFDGATLRSQRHAHTSFSSANELITRLFFFKTNFMYEKSEDPYCW